MGVAFENGRGPRYVRMRIQVVTFPSGNPGSAPGSIRPQQGIEAKLGGGWIIPIGPSFMKTTAMGRTHMVCTTA